jgi:hypothetical protein
LYQRTLYRYKPTLYQLRVCVYKFQGCGSGSGFSDFADPDPYQLSNHQPVFIPTDIVLRIWNPDPAGTGRLGPDSYLVPEPDPMLIQDPEKNRSGSTVLAKHSLGLFIFLKTFNCPVL